MTSEWCQKELLLSESLVWSDGPLSYASGFPPQDSLWQVQVHYGYGTFVNNILNHKINIWMAIALIMAHLLEML